MFFFDAAASDWARQSAALGHRTLPTKSPISACPAAFLYPLGFILLVSRRSWRQRLPRMTQGVLASLAVRFGFLFMAIGLPSLFATIVKRLIGRARPYVGAHDDPFVYLPFVWPPEYASMPSGHATTAAAAAIAIGAIWPRLRPVMWLVCADHHAQPRRHLRPSSERRDRGALVGVVGALWCGAGLPRAVWCSPPAICGPTGAFWRRLKATARELVAGPAVVAV